MAGGIAVPLMRLKRNRINLETISAVSEHFWPKNVVFFFISLDFFWTNINVSRRGVHNHFVVLHVQTV